MRDEQGYTLVELLTVLVIFGTVTGALTGLFVAAMNSEVQSNRRFQAQQDARLALAKLRREAHCASSAAVTGGSVVTLTIPNSSCKGYPSVSWCAVGSGTRFTLYRQGGTSCGSAAGVKTADYLTSSALFTYTASTQTVLAKLRVVFPVNLKPDRPQERYTLEDELTLRNSSRL